MRGLTSHRGSRCSSGRGESTQYIQTSQRFSLFLTCPPPPGPSPQTPVTGVHGRRGGLIHSTRGQPAPELSSPGASDQCLRPGPRGRGGRGTLATTGCVLGRCVCVCVPPWPLALPPSTARSVRLCGHRQGLRPPPVPAHLSGPPLTGARASGTQALRKPATRAMSQTRLRSTAPVRSAGMPPTAVAPAPHPHAPHYTPSVPGQAPSPRDSQACTLRLGRHAAGM